MSNRAWVTLATNDSYGLGALVLAHSLRRAGTAFPAVVLITPSVTEAMRERLGAVFADVVMVDVLDSGDAAHLALLQRPELGITFTKIHCWNLTQYEKCVFLDADTLVVQNCDELFEREELSAAPDVGWPDCFNSGVFVYRPSAETFAALIQFAQQRGSFDGGDQGLLNSYFSDWARGDINKHLPFLYNVTSAAFYSYLPALKHYGQDLKIIHFIGGAKPWLQQFDWRTRQVQGPEHLRGLLQLWWNLFVGQVHAQLDSSMTGVAGNLARVTPDASGAQSEAIDELTRRQGWEAGNIDYMGADSFANIWAKISQTLSQPPASPQNPPTPPPEESEPAQQLEEPQATADEAEQSAVAPISKEEALAETAAPTEPVLEETSVKSDVPSESATAVEVASPIETLPAVVAPSSQVAPVMATTEAPKEAIPSETSISPPVSSEQASVPVETADIPTESSVPVEIPVPVVEAVLAEATEPTIAAAPIVSVEIPAPVLEASAAVESTKVVGSTSVTPVDGKTEGVTKPADTDATKEEPPKPEIVAAVESPPGDAVQVSAKSDEKPAKPEEVPVATATDSPPLANTPSTEEIPSEPAAKSTEEAAQETRL